MKAVVKVGARPTVIPAPDSPPVVPGVTDKILICHPVWKGDSEYSTKLLRLLADLEPQESKLADFLVVSRFDFEADPNTLQYLSKKFVVHSCKSPHQATGWPHGCNGVFVGAVEWACRSMSARMIPRYDALLILAADVAPLQADWLPQLVRAWRAARAASKVKVAGALIPAGKHGHAHINGDCAFLSTDSDFLEWLAYRSRTMIRNGGWDWVLARQFKTRGWIDFPQVRSVWNKPNFSEAEWDEERKRGTVMFHGVKNHDLVELARKKLL